MKDEKIKVYTACQPGGSILYCQDIEDLMETVKNEIQNIEIGDEWEFEFGAVLLSQEEIDELGEFDGF